MIRGRFAFIAEGWLSLHRRVRESPRLAALELVLGRPLSVRRRALGRGWLVEEVLEAPVLFKDRFGVEVLLHPSDGVADRYEHGGYNERAEQDFCAGFLRPGMVAFDVGANYGLYSLLFATRVDGGAVFAFEPEDWNFERLVQNIALNAAHQVTPVNAAVFRVDGEVELSVYPREQHGWHTLGHPAMELDGKPCLPAATTTVPALTLDSFCRERGITRIDLLKIDVEGAELDVLEGARGLFSAGAIGCVLFEVSPLMLEGMGRTGDEVFVFLRDRGFRINGLGEGGALVPFGGAPPGGYANYVALQ
jgi:FkbM family methyltransferase